MDQRDIAWDEGTWSRPPASAAAEGGHLVVEPEPESDWWRTTAYGFVHDDAHALLVDLPDGAAIEVSWIVAYDQQFDQAGLALRADHEHWIKAGIEHADGLPQLGAVVTDVVSDWSTGEVQGWVGREVTIRASRSGDAVTIRARVEDEPWRLVRLAPIDRELAWRAGPFACSPSRGGLRVRFTAWRMGPADESLH